MILGLWHASLKNSTLDERNRKSAKALGGVCFPPRRTPPPQNLGAKVDAWDYNQKVHVGTLHLYTGDVSLFWNVLKA